MNEKDLLARAADLDAKIDAVVGVENHVVDLMQSSRRNQRFVRLLAISVAFDILLSGLLGVVAFRANSAADQASSLQQQQHTSCIANNQTKALQSQLWSYILSMQPTEGRTPAQERQIVEFRAYIAKMFAPKPC